MRRFNAVLLAVALLVGMAGCTSKAAPATTGIQLFAPADRKAGPELTGELLDGGTYDSSAVAGKVLVVNFWGSWCGPCVGEAPELEATYQAQQANGVEFLGVDVLDQLDNARGLVATQNLSYPSIFDPGSKLALGFAVQPSAVPVTIILDRQGRIAAIARGAVVQSELEPVVADLAAEAA